MIYLDYAAATPLDPGVARAMRAAEKLFANPSANYAIARETKQVISQSTADIARCLNCKSDEIVITSGGTESNNLALLGIAYANKKLGKHIVSIMTEHASIIEPINFLAQNGFSVSYVSVDEFGSINLDELESVIQNDTVLVSIALASSEIGTVQPYKKISNIIAQERRKRSDLKIGTPIYFHTDAAAVASFLPLHVDRLGVDLMSINGAKIYGPKNVGALYVRKNTAISPLLYGGGQQSGLRPGTLDVSGVVGLAQAVMMITKDREIINQSMTELSRYCLDKIQTFFPKAKLSGHPTRRLPATLNILFEPYDGDTLAAYLDDAGIAVGTGAACAASNNKPSATLLAIGLTENQAQSSLRITLGKYTTQAQIDRFIESLSSVLHKLDTIEQ